MRGTGGPLEALVTLLAVSLLAVLAVVAYRMRALDVPGSLLAFTLGVVVVVAVGVEWVVLLLLFAGGGSLASRFAVQRKPPGSGVRAVHEPRGWRNVFGNGAAAVAFASAGFFVDGPLLVFPFTVAVAVAAADTFASDLGILSPRAVLVTRPSKPVPPGTNGGVSWLGTLSGFVAASVVAVVAVAVLPLTWPWVPWVVLAGAAGSLLDSFLGALWEVSPENPRGFLSKSQVNLIATTLPAGVAGLVVWL